MFHELVFLFLFFSIEFLIAAEEKRREEKREDDGCLDFFFPFFFLFFSFFTGDFIFIIFLYTSLHRDTHTHTYSHRIIDFLIMSTVLYRFLNELRVFVYLHRTWWINYQRVLPTSYQAALVVDSPAGWRRKARMKSNDSNESFTTIHGQFGFNSAA